MVVEAKLDIVELTRTDILDPVLSCQVAIIEKAHMWSRAEQCHFTVNGEEGNTPMPAPDLSEIFHVRHAQALRDCVSPYNQAIDLLFCHTPAGRLPPAISLLNG